MEYIKKIFARELRKEQTPEEALVWDKLRSRKFKGLKFRRQHVIEGFVVDFYCHELRLAVEIDGPVHNKQKDYDTLRQMLIESKNIRFIRITNNEVHRNINILLNRIDQYIS